MSLTVIFSDGEKIAERRLDAGAEFRSLFPDWWARPRDLDITDATETMVTVHSGSPFFCQAPRASWRWLSSFPKRIRANFQICYDLDSQERIYVLNARGRIGPPSRRGRAASLQGAEPSLSLAKAKDKKVRTTTVENASQSPSRADLPATKGGSPGGKVLGGREGDERAIPPHQQLGMSILQLGDDLQFHHTVVAAAGGDQIKSGELLAPGGRLDGVTGLPGTQENELLYRHDLLGPAGPTFAPVVSQPCSQEAGREAAHDVMRDVLQDVINPGIYGQVPLPYEARDFQTELIGLPAPSPLPDDDLTLSDLDARITGSAVGFAKPGKKPGAPIPPQREDRGPAGGKAYQQAEKKREKPLQRASSDMRQSKADPCVLLVELEPTSRAFSLFQTWAARDAGIRIYSGILEYHSAMRTTCSIPSTHPPEGTAPLAPPGALVVEGADHVITPAMGYAFLANIPIVTPSWLDSCVTKGELCDFAPFAVTGEVYRTHLDCLSWDSLLSDLLSDPTHGKELGELYTLLLQWQKERAGIGKRGDLVIPPGLAGFSGRGALVDPVFCISAPGLLSQSLEPADMAAVVALCIEWSCAMSCAGLSIPVLAVDDFAPFLEGFSSQESYAGILTTSVGSVVVTVDGSWDLCGLVLPAQSRGLGDSSLPPEPSSPVTLSGPSTHSEQSGSSSTLTPLAGTAGSRPASKTDSQPSPEGEPRVIVVPMKAFLQVYLCIADGFR